MKVVPGFVYYIITKVFSRKKLKTNKTELVFGIQKAYSSLNKKLTAPPNIANLNILRNMPFLQQRLFNNVFKNNLKKKKSSFGCFYKN